MLQREVDIAVIGGGPAGMAAALAAYNQGVSRILLVERDTHLGGILNQCIHSGFGLEYFGEELTGPEYAERLVAKIACSAIEVLTRSMVTELHSDRTLVVVNSVGIHHIKAKAIVLAMGCRERTRGNLHLPGYRPAGIYTAGTAQRLVNIEGFLPGREAVVLGSGDIGLIMARRLVLEGCKVKGVFEVRSSPSGLQRNVVQCLHDFDIPLHLAETVTFIHGDKRVTGVTTCKVDASFTPIRGTERFTSCDTLLLSVGLVPENELSRQAGVELHPTTGGPIVDESRQTNVSGIFACGNVVHIHDLVDKATREGEVAGLGAAEYVLAGTSRECCLVVEPGENVSYLVPQRIGAGPAAKSIAGHIKKPLTHVRITATQNGVEVGQAYYTRLTPSQTFDIRIAPCSNCSPIIISALGGDLDGR